MFKIRPNRLRHLIRLLFAGTLALAAVQRGFASTTASLVVTAAGGGGGREPITITFNGFTETLQSDHTSTQNSIASALAAMFSRDYLKAGLCAAANGNVINFKLKTGSFQPIIIQTSSPFGFSPFGFAPVGPTTEQTIYLINIGDGSLTVTGASIIGINATDFVLGPNTCTGAVASGNRCSITIYFSPGAAGIRSATLELLNGGAVPPTMIRLSGGS